MPTASTPGRSLVSRRAIVDIVRTATLGSYGVSGFAGGVVGSTLERLGLTRPGVRVAFGVGGTDRSGGQAGDDATARSGLAIELDLTVSHGVPVAEVARQVDSAVRYAIRRALEIEVERLTIHVDGLRVRTADVPITTPPADPTAIAADDLAASGTDVA